MTVGSPDFGRIDMSSLLHQILLDVVSPRLVFPAAQLAFRLRAFDRESISLRSIVAAGEMARPYRSDRCGTKFGGRDQSAKALNHTVERSIYL